MNRALVALILVVVLATVCAPHAVAQWGPKTVEQIQSAEKNGQPTTTTPPVLPEQSPSGTIAQPSLTPGAVQSQTSQSPAALPTTPVAPSVGYPVTPTKEELKEEKKPFYWESYEKLLEQQPYLVLVDHYGRYLFRPVLFLLMMLVCLRSGRWFLDNLMGKDEKEMDPRLVRTHRILRLVVWIFALAIASESVGMSWFGAVTLPLITMLSKVISAVVWFAVCAVIVGAVAFAISTAGRDLMLSLLGGLWYLTYAKEKPSRDQEFDIGNGIMAKIVSVDPLTTTFRTNDGKTEYRPNAVAMRQHYHWNLPLE